MCQLTKIRQLAFLPDYGSFFRKATAEVFPICFELSLADQVLNDLNDIHINHQKFVIILKNTIL